MPSGWLWRDMKVLIYFVFFNFFYRLYLYIILLIFVCFFIKIIRSYEYCICCHYCRVRREVCRKGWHSRFISFSRFLFFFLNFSYSFSSFSEDIFLFSKIEGKLIEIVNTVSKTGRVIKRATMVPNTADLNTIKT